jgi:hypothetical protein
VLNSWVTISFSKGTLPHRVSAAEHSAYIRNHVSLQSSVTLLWRWTHSWSFYFCAPGGAPVVRVHEQKHSSRSYRHSGMIRWWLQFIRYSLMMPKSPLPWTWWELQRTLPLKCVVLACSCWLTENTQSVRFLLCLKARWRGDRKSTRTHRVAAFTRSSVPATPPSSCACENSSSGCPFRVWPETGATFHSDSRQEVVLLHEPKRIRSTTEAVLWILFAADATKSGWLFSEQLQSITYACISPVNTNLMAWLVAAEWLALLLRILEVPGSNLGPQRATWLRFVVVFCSPSTQCRDSTLN